MYTSAVVASGFRDNQLLGPNSNTPGSDTIPSTLTDYVFPLFAAKGRAFNSYEKQKISQYYTAWIGNNDLSSWKNHGLVLPVFNSNSLNLTALFSEQYQAASFKTQMQTMLTGEYANFKALETSKSLTQQDTAALKTVGVPVQPLRNPVDTETNPDITNAAGYIRLNPTPITPGSTPHVSLNVPYVNYTAQNRFIDNRYKAFFVVALNGAKNLCGRYDQNMFITPKSLTKPTQLQTFYSVNGLGGYYSLDIPPEYDNTPGIYMAQVIYTPTIGSGDHSSFKVATSWKYAPLGAINPTQVVTIASGSFTIDISPSIDGVILSSKAYRISRSLYDLAANADYYFYADGPKRQQRLPVLTVANKPIGDYIGVISPNIELFRRSIYRDTSDVGLDEIFTYLLGQNIYTVFSRAEANFVYAVQKYYLSQSFPPSGTTPAQQRTIAQGLADLSTKIRFSPTVSTNSAYSGQSSFRFPLGVSSSHPNSSAGVTDLRPGVNPITVANPPTLINVNAYGAPSFLYGFGIFQDQNPAFNQANSLFEGPIKTTFKYFPATVYNDVYPNERNFQLGPNLPAEHDLPLNTSGFGYMSTLRTNADAQQFMVDTLRLIKNLGGRLTAA